MKEVEYLIVGQGIAGTVLSYQLYKQNKSFCVIDKGLSDSASFMAAGVVNPLVLKRLTLTWRAAEFLDKCYEFYPELDQHLSIKSFNPTPLKKLIKSKDEELFWNKRWDKVPLEGIAKKDLEDNAHKLIKGEYKNGTVENAAWVDLKKLLGTYREFLLHKGFLREELFDYLQVENYSYKDISFEKIVFCEGAMCNSNPFFNHLPFSFNKGEILTIRSEELKLDEIYKKKFFILPLGNDLYRLGATYERDYKHGYDAESKRKEMEEQFKEIFDCEYEVIDQLAGVRPAVLDRRPLLGKHPVLSNFYIFNGLGSRGCLMAPLLSEELLQLAENNIPLREEMDISRVNKEN